MAVCGDRLTLGVSPVSTQADYTTLDRDYAGRFAAFGRNTARLGTLLPGGPPTSVTGPRGPGPQEVRALLPREPPEPGK